MEKNRIWLWSGFLVLVITVLLLIFWPRKENLDWHESYRRDSANPYGVELIYKLLEDQVEEDRLFVVQDSLVGNLTKWAEGPANYVFIGTGIWLDSLEEMHLLEFVEKGNTLFLSTNGLPRSLLSHILPIMEEGHNAYVFDTTASVGLTFSKWEDTRLELVCYDRKGAVEYNWSYWDPNLLESFMYQGVTVEPLGDLNSEWTQFVRVYYGEGLLLLHLTPLAFTNYFVREEEGLDYANKVLAYLNDGPVYWDHYSDYESAFFRSWGHKPARTRSLSGESPLDYILSQPPLAWAWYVALSLALLYLLFRAKRKQRIIPILEPNTNTSMEFIATIGQLYFQKNSHRKLAVQKWKLFLGFVRDRYHLSTRELDADFIQKLAERSGMEENFLRPLFRLAENIERSEVFRSENTLIDLHKALDEFYRNCK